MSEQSKWLGRAEAFLFGLVLGATVGVAVAIVSIARSLRQIVQLLGGTP